MGKIGLRILSEHRLLTRTTLMIFFAGILAMYLAYHLQDNFERKNLLNLAEAASLTININDLSQLTGKIEDTFTPGFMNIQNQLRQIKMIDPEIRFVYLMGYRDGKVIFLADAEEIESIDYSYPGMVYREASEKNKRIFNNGVGFTEGPLKDSWGVQVSALTPVLDENGKILAVLGIDIDATTWQRRILYSLFGMAMALLAVIFLNLLIFFYQQRKIIQLGKREMECNYHNIIDSSQDGIVAVDREMNIFFVNRTHCSLLNKDKTELIGRTFVGCRDDCPISNIFVNWFHEVIEDEKTIIKEIKCPREKDKWIEINIDPLQNSRGDLIGAVIVYRNISDKKKFVRQIKASEEKYRRIFEDSITGIYRTTPEGKYLEVNNAFARMLGFNNPDELKKEITNIGYQLYADPNEREVLKRWLLKGEVNNYEIKLNTKSGKIMWMLINARRITMEDGQEVYDGTCIDITDKKLEAEKEKKTKELLARASKMEAIGTLAAGIAHDFNNILTGIMGYTELLIEDCDSEQKPKILTYSKSILKSTHRAKNLVKKIMSYSRNKLAKKMPVSIRESVEGIVAIAEAFRLPLVEIIYQNKMAEDYFVLADPSDLDQIFLNLITNAIQSMEKRGGKVMVVLEEAKLEDVLHTGKTGKIYERYVRFSVEDEGEGIPEENNEKIFDPYFTTRTINDGTGLGLGTALQKVNNLDGKILFHSQIGQGSIFKVYLPICNPDNFSFTEVQIPNQIPKEKINQKKCRIMLIDNEQIILETLTVSLENMGFVVESFVDPLAALKYLSDNNRVDFYPPGIIFVDYSMEKMNGLKLAEKINILLPDLPMVLMTGYLEGVEMANFDYIKSVLNKPFVATDMLPLINQYTK